LNRNGILSVRDRATASGRRVEDTRLRHWPVTSAE
jgi:hypothetical protein